MRHRYAFSSIELLIVVAIISLLFGLLLSAISRVRAVSARIDCASHLRQLALAIHQCHDRTGFLPTGQIGPNYNPKTDIYGWGPHSKAWSWEAKILPYIERDDLANRGRVPQGFLDASSIVDVKIPLLLCAADASSHGAARTDAGNFNGIALAQTNYKAVAGSNWGRDSTQNWNFPTPWRRAGSNGSYDGLDDGDGAMFRSDIFKKRRFANFIDGTSNTLLIGEDVAEENLWLSWAYSTHAYGTCAIPLNSRSLPDGEPIDPGIWYDTSGFRSRHPGGANFAFADGSVKFVSDRVDLGVYRAAATIAGGETLPVP